MSLTDFERNDGLDDLTSDELELRAFGPDPRRPRLRGHIRRPARADLAPAPRRTRRRLAVVLGVAAALVGGALYATATEVDVYWDEGGVYWIDEETVYWEDELEVEVFWDEAPTEDEDVAEEVVDIGDGGVVFD
jgi:hypothetical protein